MDTAASGEEKSMSRETEAYKAGYAKGKEDAQQWIPCSERLPKPYEYCLWTTTDGRVVYHHCDGLFSNYTAWMPLPEPWRGEEK